MYVSMHKCFTEFERVGAGCWTSVDCVEDHLLIVRVSKWLVWLDAIEQALSAVYAMLAHNEYASFQVALDQEMGADCEHD